VDERQQGIPLQPFDDEGQLYALERPCWRWLTAVETTLPESNAWSCSPAGFGGDAWPLVPTRSGYYIAGVLLPDWGISRAYRQRGRGGTEGHPVQSIQPGCDCVYRLDFLGGGYRNNAAPLFVLQKPWRNER